MPMICAEPYSHLHILGCCLPKTNMLTLLSVFIVWHSVKIWNSCVFSYISNLRMNVEMIFCGNN